MLSICNLAAIGCFQAGRKPFFLLLSNSYNKIEKFIKVLVFFWINMMDGCHFGRRLREYRHTYGLFEDDLVRKANLNTSAENLIRFERMGDFKLLAEGDVEKILAFTPLPKSYFDGSLETVMKEVYKLMELKEPVPEQLMKEGKLFVTLWKIEKDERIPINGFAPSRIGTGYLDFLLITELYDEMLAKGIQIKQKDILPSRDILSAFWQRFQIDFNPRDYSHGDILKAHMKYRIWGLGASPVELSKVIFSKRERIYELFGEYRFDEATVRRLRKGRAWHFTTFKDYAENFVCPQKVFEYFLNDDSFNCPTKNILPDPEVYYPLGVVWVYHMLKGKLSFES